MLKDAINESFQQNEQHLISLADQVWDFAEISFTEHKSAKVLADFLEQQRFTVKRGVANIPTAFVASYGSGSPIIGILGEFDALPNLSQAGAQAEFSPLQKDGNGHGCGHNLLGTAGIGSVLALRQLMDDGVISGTIRYYGCPAEEGGAGKVFMARDGLFNDLDAAISWHPLDRNLIQSTRSLATSRAAFKFTGTAAHAGAAPHLGRSALDAVEIMNIASNFLREHITTDARLHYAITDAGGISPNVVQHEAEVVYVVRAPNYRIVQSLVERLHNIAKGAALMTGTTFEKDFSSGMSDTRLNKPLEQLMYDCMVEIGPNTYTAEEYAFAEAIRATFNEEARRSKVAIHEEIEPYQYDQGIMYASTDVGDVSWHVPTVQCATACFAADTALHTWQVTSQGRHALGYKGMLLAGKVMGLTAAKLFLSPDILLEAKQALEDDLQGGSYICPIPSEVKVEEKVALAQLVLV